MVQEATTVLYHPTFEQRAASRRECCSISIKFSETPSLHLAFPNRASSCGIGNKTVDPYLLEATYVHLKSLIWSSTRQVLIYSV